MIFNAFENVESSDDEPEFQDITLPPDFSLVQKELISTEEHFLVHVSDPGLQPLPPPIANDEIIAHVSLRVIYLGDLFSENYLPAVDILLLGEQNLLYNSLKYSGVDDGTFYS